MLLSSSLNNQSPLIKRSLVLVSLFISLSAWAVSSPVGSSSDDNYHLASIWCANGYKTNQCEPGNLTDSRNIPYGVATAGLCFLGDQEVTGQCARSTSTAANSLVETNRLASSQRMGIYYHVANLLVTSNIDLSVVLIRLLNVAVLLVLLLLGFLASRESRAPNLALVFIFSIIPYGNFFIASTNSSSWLISGIGAFWYFSLLNLKAEKNNQRYAVVGAALAAFVALSARSEAQPFLLISIIAVAIYGLERSSFLAKKFFLIVSGLTALISILLLRTSTAGEFAQHSFVYNDGTPVVRPPIGVFMSNLQTLPSLFLGLMGGLESDLGAELPSIVPWCVLIVVGFLMLDSLVSTSKRLKMTVSFVGTLLIVIPIYVLQKSLLLVGEEVLPRYLLPLWVVFLGLFIYERSFEYPRSQYVSMAILLSIANSLALRQNLLRYTIGIDAYSVVNLNKANEWWWHIGFIPSPMIVWVLGSLAMLISILVLTTMHGGTGGIRTPGPFEPSAFKADAFVHSATVPLRNASARSAL